MTPVDAARLVQARKLRPRARVDLTAENIGQLDFGETTALYEACACIFFLVSPSDGCGVTRNVAHTHPDWGHSRIHLQTHQS
jgi:hypothetical protein